MNIFNSLLPQLVKYDVHTTRKMNSIHAIFYHILSLYVLFCLFRSLHYYIVFIMVILVRQNKHRHGMLSISALYCHWCNILVINSELTLDFNTVGRVWCLLCFLMTVSICSCLQVLTVYTGVTVLSIVFIYLIYMDFVVLCISTLVLSCKCSLLAVKHY